MFIFIIKPVLIESSFPHFPRPVWDGASQRKYEARPFFWWTIFSIMLPHPGTSHSRNVGRIPTLGSCDQEMCIRKHLVLYNGNKIPRIKENFSHQWYHWQTHSYKMYPTCKRALWSAGDLIWRSNQIKLTHSVP